VIHHPRSFKTPDIHDFFESKARVPDVSPDNPLGEIPASFSYGLARGEARGAREKEEAKRTSSTRETPVHIAAREDRRSAAQMWD